MGQLVLFHTGYRNTVSIFLTLSGSFAKSFILIVTVFLLPLLGLTQLGRQSSNLMSLWNTFWYLGRSCYPPTNKTAPLMVPVRATLSHTRYFIHLSICLPHKLYLLVIVYVFPFDPFEPVSNEKHSWCFMNLYLSRSKTLVFPLALRCYPSMTGLVLFEIISPTGVIFSVLVNDLVPSIGLD